MKKNFIEILKKFSGQVLSEYPGADVRAFGSYPKGTATPDSDLDVCVILGKVTPEDRLHISDIAWEVGLDYDILISTIVISEDEYNRGPMSVSPLIETVRSEGITV